MERNCTHFPMCDPKYRLCGYIFGSRLSLRRKATFRKDSDGRCSQSGRLVLCVQHYWMNFVILGLDSSVMIHLVRLLQRSIKRDTKHWSPGICAITGYLSYGVGRFVRCRLPGSAILGRRIPSTSSGFLDFDKSALVFSERYQIYWRASIVT